LREATSEEVKTLRAEARQLKEALAEQMLENRLLKKAFPRMGETIHEISSHFVVASGHSDGSTVAAIARREK
jgi:hypothetical protein